MRSSHKMSRSVVYFIAITSSIMMLVFNGKLSASGANAQEDIINDDFNGVLLTTKPNYLGWKLIHDGKGTEFQLIDSQMLKLEGRCNFAAEAVKLLPKKTGRMTLQARVRLKMLGSACLPYQMAIIAFVCHDKVATTMNGLNFSYDRRVEGVFFEYDKWYSVSIEVDSASGTYSCWLNDIAIVNRRKLVGWPLDAVVVTAHNCGHTRIQYDDIVVKDALVRDILGNSSQPPIHSRSPDQVDEFLSRICASVGVDTANRWISLTMFALMGVPLMFRVLTRDRRPSLLDCRSAPGISVAYFALMGTYIFHLLTYLWASGNDSREPEGIWLTLLLVDSASVCLLVAAVGVMAGVRCQRKYIAPIVAIFVAAALWDWIVAPALTIIQAYWTSFAPSQGIAIISSLIFGWSAVVRWGWKNGAPLLVCMALYACLQSEAYYQFFVLKADLSSVPIVIPVYWDLAIGKLVMGGMILLLFLTSNMFSNGNCTGPVNRKYLAPRSWPSKRDSLPLRIKWTKILSWIIIISAIAGLYLKYKDALHNVGH